MNFNMNLTEDTFKIPSCGSCKEQLSVFPVYSYGNGKSICGRCNPDKGAKRNVALELFLEGMQFPCKNRFSGCLEVLSPTKLKTHEPDCQYISWDCPTGKCEWRGTLNNFEEHYTEEHSVLILNNYDSFSILLEHGNWEKAYLLRNQIGIFLIRLIKSNLILRISICLLNIHRLTKIYFFDITMRNEMKDTLLKLENCKVQNEYDKSNPYRIEMKKYDENYYFECNIVLHENSNCSDTLQFTEYNDFVLKQLECPICYEYMSAPIYQCISGHIICDICRMKTLKCPRCRILLTENIRNVVLEKIAENILYKCKNQECKAIYSFSDKNKHINECEYTSCNCPVNNCCFENNYIKLYQHLNKVHLNKISQVKITYKAHFNKPEVQILIKSYSIFVVNYILDDNNFQIWVEHIGSESSKNKFAFILNIQSNDQEQICVKSKCFHWLAARPHNNVIRLPLVTLAPFIDSNMLLCEVKITE